MFMPSGVVAAGKPAPRVQVIGASLGDVDATLAITGYRFNLNGDIETNEGSGEPWVVIGQWLLLGTPSDYECQYKNPDDATTPEGSNIWLSMGSTRIFGLNQSGIGFKSANGPMIIRDAATLDELADANVFQSVSVEP